MQKRIRSCLVLSLLLSTGCGNKPGDAQESIGETTKSATENWLTVTADKDALADAVRRAEQIKKEEYERVFAHLGDDHSYVSFETIEMLSGRPDAIERLKRELPASEVNATGVGAALLLCQLHVSDGRGYLVRVFERGDAKKRIRVLHGIDCASYDSDSEQAHRAFVFADKRLVEELLCQLDDENPEVVKAAIQACGALEVPGVQAKLLALLDRPKVPDPGRILFWLSKGPRTEEVLDAAIRVSKAQADKEDHWGVSLFEAFVRSEDAELRKRARDELKRQLATWPDDGAVGYRVDRIDLLEALAETSDRNELDWLKETYEKEHSYYAEPLLVALVRLEGAEGRARLLALLKDPKRSSIAIGAAGKVFSDSGDEEIVRELAQHAEGNDQQEIQNICRALQSVGGELARKELVKLVDGLDPADRASFLGASEQDGPTLDEINTRLVKAALIDESAAKSAVRRLKARSNEKEAGTPGLLDVLTASDIVASFDAETGILPCRHDELVADFAGHSRGLFMPTAISEQFHQRHKSDFDAEYTLRFVHAGKLYTGRLRNFGDWYDVERTVLMINQALADAQRKERFVAVATDGQVASFVFANPKLLAPLAKEFHLPLGADPNEAMHKGQAYERVMLEKIRQAKQ